MKRAILVGSSTAAGVVAVLSLNPAGGAVAGGQTPTAATLASQTTPSTTTPSTTTPGTTTPSTSGSTGSGSGTSSTGTFTGTAYSAGRYGTVQVQITVSGGQVTDVATLQLPDADHHSAQISSYAGPVLKEQALAAQSATIDGVSGATFTTEAFRGSLLSALQQAGLA